MTWDLWSFKAPTGVPHVKLMRVFHLGGLLILPYSVGCHGGGNPCLWAAFKERSWKGIAVPRRFLTFMANSAPTLSDSLSNGLALWPSPPGLPRTYLTRCAQHVHHTWNRVVVFFFITKIKINRNQVREKKMQMVRSIKHRVVLG